MTVAIILGYKLTNLTPVLAVTYTPTVNRSRLQIRRQCLVTHIVEIGVTRQTCCSTDIVLRTFARLNRRVVQFGIQHVGVNGDNSLRSEVGFCGIGFRYQLNLTLVNTVVCEPAETHVRGRITVDSSNLVVRELFADQFTYTLIHNRNLRRNNRQVGFRIHTVYLGLLFSNQERDETRNRIILNLIFCLCLYYFLRINNRRNRLYNHFRGCFETAVFCLYPCSGLSFFDTGYLTVLDRSYRWVFNCPAHTFVIRVLRLYLSYQRSRITLNNLYFVLQYLNASHGNNLCIRVELIGADIITCTLRTSQTVNICCRSLSSVRFVQ